MSLAYQCSECGSSYQVSRMDEELHLLLVVMPCPESCCSGNVRVVDEPDGKLPKKTTAKILFEACMGKGFPADRKCSPEALRDLLVGGFITSLDLYEINADQDRSIIKSMSVGIRDGKSCTIHFAMSNLGATIYKVIQDG